MIDGWRPKRERHVLADDPEDEDEMERDKQRTRFHTEPEERKQAKERKDPEIIAHDVASVWGGPADPVHEAEVAATDQERVAAAVNRACRLSPAQAKVVRYIINHPEGHRLTYPEIAQGAGVSVRTVNTTIQKLAGNRATLHRIFPRQ